jgi:hypothetical protein
VKRSKSKKPSPPAPTHPAARELPGTLIADEIGRLTDGFEKLDYLTDSHMVYISIDLEHNHEAFWLMGIYDCDGSIAKQIVAECERVAAVYMRLAEVVKGRVWKDWLEKNGGTNFVERR